MQTLPGDHSLDTRPVMVTIHCTAYNHEPFIRQCLDGFIMQKTDFRFEAIVHDDASTDGTADIIREYASKYPEIIKPIYQIENQYSKKNGIIKRILNDHTRGKYIAICEGDDYWIDPLKLQKQVDFLESHPDYVMCSHRYDEYQQAIGKYKKKTIQKDVDYDLNSLVTGEWLFHPLSIMYSVSGFDKTHYRKYGISVDVALIYELLRNGKKGRCLGDTMAVYRIHSGGVWSGISLKNKWLQEIKVRLPIYEIERTTAAAKLVLTIFYRPLSRKWILQNYKLFFHIYKIICKHFGFLFASKLYLNKIFLGHNIDIKAILNKEEVNSNQNVITS